MLWLYWFSFIAGFNFVYTGIVRVFRSTTDTFEGISCDNDGSSYLKIGSTCTCMTSKTFIHDNGNNINCYTTDDLNKITGTCF